MGWQNPLPQLHHLIVGPDLQEQIYISSQSCVMVFRNNFILKRRNTYNAAIQELNFMHAVAELTPDVLAFVPFPDGGAGFIMHRLHPIDPAQLSPQAKMETMYQLQDLVHALHQRGVIHGDIKLANFLRDAAGNVKVCDFGSAVWLNQSTPPYAASDRYCSPDRLADKGLRIPLKPADDYYALGWTIWELFTGKVPFEDILDKEQVIEHVLAGAKPDLDEVDNEEAKALIRYYCGMS
jgi:serine/threonine protein kinase